MGQNWRRTFDLNRLPDANDFQMAQQVQFGLTSET